MKYTTWDQEQYESVIRCANTCMEALIRIDRPIKSGHAHRMYEAFTNAAWCNGCKVRARYIRDKLARRRRARWGEGGL